MKVVVTGGAGFIGANVCRALRDAPEIDRVVAFDDLSTGFRSNLAGLDVELVEGTFVDPDQIGSAVMGADAIVHLGARPSVPRSISDPAASHAVNATGTINVLEAARRAGGPQVIVASSSSVYGSNPVLPKHEDLATRPLSPYASSKLAAEAAALAWQHSFDLPTLVFRFFNVFGPLQSAGHAYAAVVPAFVAAALSDEPLQLHGDGTQSRDFTYVDTVAAVILEAVTKRVTVADPVNLAFGTRTTLCEMITMLEDLLGHKVKVDHAQPRIGDVAHSQATNERLTALFPGVEAIDLRTGLARTIEWFKSDPRSGLAR